jgi:homoserine O-acetyltransferase
LTELRHPPLAPEHIDAPHAMAELGDLPLESGEVIRDYRQSYVTHGALNRDRSNAILICAALTGTHHRLDFLIGPGRALDPAQWFIVATDPIGNGLSTSPSNSARQGGMHFPSFGLRDMVNAQHALLTRHLGMANVHAIVGASMGGMQALQWVVSYPHFARRAAAHAIPGAQFAEIPSAQDTRPRPASNRRTRRS